MRPLLRCLVLLLFKHLHITPSSTYLEYLSFKVGPKSPAESVLQIISLSKWVMVVRRHRLLQPDFSKCRLESAPLNKKTELIQKDPLPPAVEWKRETAATQTLPWASFLSRLSGRGMQERDSLFCTGRPAEEKQQRRLRRGCPTCPAQGVLGTHTSPGDWPTPASQALLSSDFTAPGQKKREH